MSALVNTLLSHQQAITPLRSSALSTNTTTSISTITRIDYNLRFTKQAVLVVAKNTEQYSHLASQYLVSLSHALPNSRANQVNVAFVTASHKLNDIQMRCRLVEQLFVNTLFDPEQSLAVSILKFARLQEEDISIIIEHGQTLSLQLKYELCQLVNLAKKNKFTINVVIFGLTEAAHQLSMNKRLFKNKMAVIDAETGQVISFDDKKIQVSKAKNTSSIWKKISLAAAVLIIIMSIIGFWGYQKMVETTHYQLPPLIQNVIEKSAEVLQTVMPVEASKTEKPTQIQKKEETTVAEIAVVKNTELQASSEDISLAILSPLPAPKPEPTTGNPAEVIAALAIEAPKTLTNKITTNSIKPEQGIAEKNEVIEALALKQKSSTEPLGIDSYYYQNQAVVYEQGYVIQIAGFVEHKLWQNFINEYATSALYSYQRLLKEQSFIVVTSKVYPSKVAAKAAMSYLPESLKNRKPWLKDISSIIKEINTFKR
ncbi:MAG: hypothetical protein V5789_03100 [Colwellia sp.]